MKFNVERLDINDPRQIEDFEKGFYEAFIEYSNPGIRALWIWDDEERRLKSPIPYEHQEIYFIRDEEGRISSAGAFNLKLDHFQSEAYGFRRPRIDEIWNETLIMFSRGSTLKKLVCLEHARRIVVPRTGVKWSYATCNETTLKVHKRMGVEVLDRSVTNDQVRYFIRLDCSRPFINCC